MPLIAATTALGVHFICTSPKTSRSGRQVAELAEEDVNIDAMDVALPFPSIKRCRVQGRYAE